MKLALSKDEYEFSAYRPEWRDQVIELQKHLWSSDPAINSAYMEWKHERNPSTSPPLIVVALYGGRVVAMRGFVGTRWEVGCSPCTFPGPCACDLVIAPEHRNRGLLSPLMQFANRELARHGVEYVFNTSPSMTTYLSALASGWRDIGPLQPMGYVFTPGSNPGQPAPAARRESRLAGFWRRLRVRSGAFAEAAPAPVANQVFAQFDRSAMGPTHLLDGGMVAERSPRPEAMAGLISRLPWDGRLRLVRDAAYFNWRYRNPLSHYRFLYSGEAQLDGYLVMRAATTPDRPESSIVEWEAVNLAVRRRLLDAAIAAGRFSVLHIWASSFDDSTQGCLRDAGFHPLRPPPNLSDYRPSVLVRCLREERPLGEWTIGGRHLARVADWDVRMIISDGM